MKFIHQGLSTTGASEGGGLSTKLSNYIIVVITFVWCVNFIVPIFNPDYKPPPEIHLALMAIIGLFAGQRINKDKEDEKK